MIEIIYIATDDYSKYFDSFASSLKYFWPGMPKVVRILSNVERDYTIECEDVLSVEFIKIFDLIYPCINLNKTNFITQLKPIDSKYVFYFDADTMFFPTPNDVWDNLKFFMDEGFFCMGKHPFYQLKDEVEWKNSSIENFYKYFTTKDESQETFIEDYEYTYLISSFFCAKRDIMKKMCDYINNMIRNDMRRDNGYKIPFFMDENYFNKVVYDVYKQKNDLFNVKIGNYILYNTEDNIITINENFIIQKGFKNSFKRLRR